MTDTQQGRFGGKVAIVTGAGSGFGRLTAQGFARGGAHVLLAGRTESKLEGTAAMIREAGGSCEVQVTDVCKPDDLRDMVAAAMRRWGRLDILFSNAGTLGQGAPLCDLELASFDESFHGHARAVWLGMKYAIPEMLKVGGGCIVNMSSNTGLVGTANQAGYSAAMWAVVGLTKCAAVEYAKFNIRVNAVCPAQHETDMAIDFRSRFTEEAWNQRVAQRYPRGRIGDPADVANAVLFLCSDDAANIHGVALPLDGGFTAQ